MTATRNGRPAVEGTGRRHVFAVGNATYQDGWGDLPGVAGDVEAVIDVLKPFGYRPAEHFERGLIDPATGAELQERLLGWVRSAHADRDTLIVYLAGHGVNEDTHYMVCHETTCDFAGRTVTALPTARLIEVAGRAGVRRLLVILDACYAGDGAADALALAARNQLVAAASEADQRRHWDSLEVLAAARCGEPAVDGLFAPTLVTVLREQVLDKPILAGNRQRYVHVDDVAGAVNRALESRGVPQRADHAQLHGDGMGSGFLPNPHYAGPLPDDWDVAEQRLLAERRRMRVIGLDEHFGPRARGVHAPGQAGHYFTGRTAVLTRLAGWLRGQEEQAVRVFQVTGGPGTGKSSVLARLIALADPVIRSGIPDSTVVLSTDVPEGAIDLAVHAARRTKGEVLGAIAAALDAPGAEPANLVKAMCALDRPFTMVVDALDEAGTGGDGRDCLEITAFLRLAAAQAPHLRLVLGGRPHVFASYPAGGTVVRVDLDRPDSVGHGDIAAYAARLLHAPHGPGSETGIAQRLIARAAVDVADVAGRNYLVARLIARALASPGEPFWQADPSQWPGLLPLAADQHASPARAIGASFRWALNTQLGEPEADRARAMLVPLAYAQGAGLPLAGVWTAAAGACVGRPVTEDDLVRLLGPDAAAPYVVEALDTHGRSVYRLYHQALADDLREQAEGTPGRAPGPADGAGPRPRLARGVFGRLSDAVPVTGEGQRDWRLADPYLLEHLSGHAADAGQVDALLDDIGYLTHVDPAPLLAVLDQARTPRGRLTAAVYRDCVDHLRDAKPETRRWALATSATRFRADDLGRRLRPAVVPHHLWPRWSTGLPDPGLRNTLAGHLGYVRAVTCTVIDGRPVAVTGSSDATARLWDMETGRPMGLPLVHGDGVRGVACTVVGELPVAVTVDGSKEIRRWDLRQGRPIGRSARIANPDFVSAVACTTAGGRPVAITGGGQRGGMQLWDLTRDRLTGLPFPGSSAWISTVACTVLDGRPVVLSGDHGGTVAVWDPASRKLLGAPMPSDMGRAEAIACGRLDGRPVAVVLYYNDYGQEPAVGVWDLDARQRVKRFYPGGKVQDMTCVTVNERLVAVTGDYDSGIIRLRDLARNRPLGSPFQGNSLGIISMAPAAIGGKPALVTVGHDTVAKVWDLTRPRPTGKLRRAHSGRIHKIACAVVGDRPIAVTGSWDNTIQMWDIATASQVGVLGTSAHINGFACVTAPDGRAFAVTSTMSEATVWDLARRSRVGTLPVGGTGIGGSIAAAVYRGAAVAVTADHGSVKAWDLASAKRIDIFPPDCRASELACVAREDGKAIVIGRDDRTIWAWDLDGHQWSTRPVDAGYLGNSLEIDGGLVDGKPLAVIITHQAADGHGGLSGRVTMWDLARHRRIGAKQTSPGDFLHAVTCASIDERPVAFTGGKDRFLRMWDLADGGLAAEWPMPAEIGAIARSPDGSLVVGVASDIVVLDT